MIHQMKTPRLKSPLGIAASAILLTAGLASITGCDRNAPSVSVTTSRVNAANYGKIRLGMSKAQAEEILGPATTAETKDMVIYKRTTYRYEDGQKFILLTFKNDELDSKDSNLGS